MKKLILNIDPFFEKGCFARVSILDGEKRLKSYSINEAAFLKIMSYLENKENFHFDYISLNKTSSLIVLIDNIAEVSYSGPFVEKFMEKYLLKILLNNYDTYFNDMQCCDERDAKRKNKKEKFKNPTNFNPEDDVLILDFLPAHRKSDNQLI